MIGLGLNLKLRGKRPLYVKDPLTVTGLTSLFLDTMTVANGTVSQWTDLAGSGRHLLPLSTPNKTVSSPGCTNSGGLIQVNVSVNHTYSTGDSVTISGVNGTTEANGTWSVTVTGLKTFTLNGSTFAHAWTSGGTVVLNSSRNPSKVTAGLNGHDTLSLAPSSTYVPGTQGDGGKGLQSSAGLATYLSAASSYVYALVKVVDAVADLAPNHSMGNAGIVCTNNGTFGMMVRATGLTPCAQNAGANIDPTNGECVDAQSGLSASTWGLLTWRHVNSKVGIRIGGGAWAETDSGNTILGSSLRLGQNSFGNSGVSGATGAGLHGEIAALATFNTALSAVDDAGVLGYLQQYGGLA